MKKSILQKNVAIDLLVEDLRSASSFMFFEYRGLTASLINDLRKELRLLDAQIFIKKNVIFNRSIAILFPDQQIILSGPNAIVISKSSELSALQKIIGMTAKFEFLVLKFAYLEKQIFGSESLQVIANIPNRKGLYTIFACNLLFPLQKMMLTLKKLADSEVT